MHESDENMQVTLESLKHRILDMSVISEGSRGFKRFQRQLNSKELRQRHSVPGITGKYQDAHNRFISRKKIDPGDKDRLIAAHREFEKTIPNKRSPSNLNKRPDDGSQE